ncbi:carboxypeptidase-like regulatory domain-containing protein [Fibrella forsythiae]|uniref:Carboxypeptidase-like regulatory domain-containing protein n=1 Tax=Fibrella forsythiae TaxID=2817061 RepID=A0ABS3JQQ6_9BACT|nr:carboxypeptidase-like regulatory domain-containing protein [Fibrella forsythiae]MBO0952332.1 carboxypeptidase-like regulatory domain-containing protein [Fibrella forsythiae]
MTRLIKRYSAWLGLLAILFSLTTDGLAQGQDSQITFTGIITGGKSNEPLPLARIFIPRAGKGVLSATNGYFALPVFPGDSVIFSYVGYKTQYHIIPRRLTEPTYSAVVALQEDVKLLSEVKVYPYPTEELFKQALINMKLPDQRDRDALARNTDPQALLRAMAATPMGAMSNHQYFMNQQFLGREAVTSRGSVTTFPFLNPFAWANFIKSVKRGDFKTKEYRQGLNNAPPENIRRDQILNN